MIAVGLVCGLVTSSARAGLALHAERSSPYDLEVTGKLVGVEAGAIRYLRWADIRALPSRTLRLADEFTKGEQTVTAVMLTDVWAALPVAPAADTVLAFCTDGYAAIYPAAFIEKEKPFLVLEINGLGPDRWPPPGIKYNPGPYVVSVSEQLAPTVATTLDVGHKRPWGTNRLEIATYAERMAPAFTGAWANLSATAAAGREIWIHSCLSCHVGPQGLVGGSKSGRPFEVLAAHAGFNEPYFRTYVRTPTTAMAGAKMEAHPHYNDAQLDALVAFVRAAIKP